MEAGPIDRCLAQWLRCLFWVMMSPEAGKMFVFLFHLPEYPLSHHSVWATGLDRGFFGFKSDLRSAAVVSEVTCLKTRGSLAADPATEPQPLKSHCFAFFKNLVLSKGPCVQPGL